MRAQENTKIHYSFSIEVVARLVEIIGVDEYFQQHQVGLVIVKSLEHLKKIAETFEEPFIFKKGKKEYFFFHHGVCYNYKE